LVILGVIFGLGYSLRDAANEIRLPLLAIAGVVVLFATLALVSVSFATFGLQDPKQALALPEGSVRAAIALALIVLFAVLTVYLYASAASSGVSSAPNLTLDEKNKFLAALDKNQIIAVVPPKDDNPPFTVYFQARGPGSIEFAKEIFVLLGTLVTSVASF